MSNELLKGKTALITGAATGIGRAAALVFAREGAKVAIIDINQEEGEKTAARIRGEGGEALFIAAEVSSANEMEAAVLSTVKAFGRIDCALNNAGIDGANAPTHEYDEASWDRVIAVNLKGVWLAMKYEINQMLAQGGGAIVNTSSVAGQVGVANLSAYVASKHGVIGVSRSAALEYVKRNIRVNVICPGVIQTPLLDHALYMGHLELESLLVHQPIGRMGQPEEVAEAAAWLCSDKASFVTGHAMAVDGGWLSG